LVSLSPTSWKRTQQSSWNWKEQKRDCAFGLVKGICACASIRDGASLFLGGEDFGTNMVTLFPKKGNEILFLLINSHMISKLFM